MTIYYRTAGPWGSGTGANLGAAQVDGNFYDISTRLQYLELHPTEPVQIASVSTVGNQLSFFMSDGTSRGPVILPTIQWNFRGGWQPSTIYLVNDIVIAPSSAVYVVIFPHTSATAFAAGANDGAGHNFYGLLLSVPAAVMPLGGARGYVLSKLSDNNYDVIWQPPQVPLGGNAGQVLQKLSSAGGDAAWSTILISELGDVGTGAPADGDYLRWDEVDGLWVNQQPSMLNVLTASSWSPVAGDEGTFMVLANGAANTLVTVPNDATSNFKIGSELHVHQDGTGTVTVGGEVGVTIRRHASFSNVLLGQYATATVKKTAANEWRLFGLLAGT